MQRMKEDANKMKQMDLQHHRAMSQLKKEHRKHENTVSYSGYILSVHYICRYHR